MIILYIILLFVFICSIRPLNSKEKFNADYISKDATNIIKGVCIWIVFGCHVGGYLANFPSLNRFDECLFFVNRCIRQLMVVPFLFISGYGVSLSKLGKNNYNILKKRCLPTLLNFDVAVFIYVLVNIALHQELKPLNTILAFTGWESIGNSNWYIFCILVCYALSWLSFKFCNSSHQALLSIWCGVIIYVVIMFCVGKGSWWYDSIFAYAAGCTYAIFKKQIEDLIKKHYWTVLLISLFVFALFYLLPNIAGISMNIAGIFLCSLMILFLSKFHLRSRILAWSGVNLFPLYIYQRIPMIVFPLIIDNSAIGFQYWYILASFVFTLIIALLYRFIRLPLG